MESLQDLLNALFNKPVLALTKRCRSSMIYEDAGKYGMGVTLLKQKNIENEEEYEKVGFWSKKFTDTERDYSATEHELFSVFWAIVNLRPYIEGTKSIVRPDHDVLRCMMSFSDPHGRLDRWRLTLS